MKHFYTKNVQWMLFSFMMLLMSLSSFAQMSGTYTIDASSSASATNYKSFGSAVSDMVSGTRADGGPTNGPTISSAVTFNVANGSYNEQVDISSITGVSATNRITFKGASSDSSKVRIYWASTASNVNDWTVRLNGAPYVTFKWMTLERTGTQNFGAVWRVEAGAHNSTVTNCILKASLNTSTGNANAVILNNNASGYDSNMVVTNNAIKYGSYAIWASGASGANEKGWNISGNNIDSFYYMGIYALYSDAAKIDNNFIHPRGTYLGGTNYAVYTQYCFNAMQISNNKIDMYTNCSNVVYLYGIYGVYNDGTASKKAKIYNNMMYFANNLGYYTYAFTYAFYQLYNTYQTIVHNSVYSNCGYASSYTCYMYNYSGTSNNTFANNIINVDNGALLFYNPYMTYWNTWNKNVYYAPSSGNKFYGDLNGSVSYYTTLTAWKSAVAPKDANSVYTDPQFTSATNLHANATSINNIGNNYGITTDIDGDARGTTPDPGCDEFTPPPTDLAVTALDSPNAYCTGTKNIRFRLTNAGSSAITSASVKWYIDGTLQGTTVFSGSIAVSGSTSLLMGSASISAGAHTFAAKITDVNLAGLDATASNDTLIVTKSNSLNGTFTIGGTSPDYATFTAAENDLQLRGVCGPVVFNVRDGSYTENVTFKAIGGASATNTITFQSQSLDSSKVSLNAASSTTTTALGTPMTLSSVTWHRFRKMAIEVTGTNTQGYAINMIGGYNSNNIFEGCKIRAIKGSTSSYAIYDYNYGTSKPDSANTWKNCDFKYGNYMGYFYYYSATAPTLQASTTFDGCIMDSSMYTGMYLYYQDKLKFNNNRVSNMSYPQTYQYTMFVYYCNNSTFTGNRFDQRGNAQTAKYGIYHFYSTGSATKPNLFANNQFVINVTSSGSAYSVYDYYTNYTQYYHNSFSVIPVSGTAQNSYPIYIYYPQSTMTLRNNVFANYAGGYAIYRLYGTLSSNFNDFYQTGGSFLAYHNGTNCIALANWKAASSQDANSKQKNPGYINNTNDLHSNSTDLNGAATPLAAVTTDIDGQTRDAYTPDLGMDEFTPQPNDAGVSLIDSPASGFCGSGTKNVVARIKNYGTSTLTQASVAWKLNGVAQTPYLWTGSLTSGSQSSQFTLGSATFGSNVTNVKAWTYDPNLGTDGIASNDTTIINVAAAMNGVYTVGGASPDFTNFATMVAGLNTRGVCGPVTIRIRDGYYAGNVTIGNITGASATNKILITSQSQDSSKVWITKPMSTSTTSYTNSTLTLAGTKWLTISKIGFVTTASLTTYYSGSAIYLSGSCSNDTIKGCYIRSQGGNTTTSYGIALYNTTAGNANNYITIQGNGIRNFYFGVYEFGPTTVGSTNRYNKILGNQIDSIYYYAIYRFYSDSGKIIGNKINVQNSGYGIYNYAYYSQYGDDISGNYINMPGGGYGIMQYYFGYGSGAPLTRARITNNMVIVGGSSTGYGLYFFYSYNTDIAYNTFHNNSTVTSTANMPMYFYNAIYSASYLNKVRNNNFTRSGAGYNVGIYYPSPMSSYGIANWDYNNYWQGTAGAINIYNASTAATYTTLSGTGSWRATSLKDSNAVIINPRYSDSTSNLHATASAFNDLGNKSWASYVTKDWDGDTRGTTSDIGADEYTPAADDAGITAILSPAGAYCSGSTAVNVTLKNFGTGTLTSASIFFTVAGSPVISYAWTGSIAPGSSATASLGTYSFTGSNLSLSSYTTLPNGVTDLVTYNDATAITGVNQGMSGTYTIGGTSPSYATFAAAMSALTTNGVCGNTVMNIRDGVYTTPLTITSIPGASALSTITFKSESNDSSKVYISRPASNSSSTADFCLSLSGAQWVNVKKISLLRTGTGFLYSNVGILVNNAYNDSINSCIIRSQNTSTSTAYGVYMVTTRDTNVVFNNNLIRNWAYNFYESGPSGNTNRSIKLLYNTIDSFYYYGILSQYSSGSTYGYNTIKDGITQTGIALYNYNYYDVAGDYIYGNKILLPNGGYGMYDYYRGYAGGYMTATSPRARVFNNSFSLGGGISPCIGIYAYFSNYTDYVYNNFYINNTTTNVLVTGMDFYYGGSLNRIMNNNFVTTGSGVYGVVNQFSTGFARWNYNNYFTPTSGAVNGYWNGSTYGSLSSWKTNTSVDSNSLTVNPYYVSTSYPQDLHATGLGIDGQASPLPFVTRDMDNQLRSATTPDIGADEYIPPAVDAGVSAIDSPLSYCGTYVGQAVARVKNFGSSTLTSVTVNWKLDGVTQTPRYKTGLSLATGSTDTLRLGAISIGSGTHSVKAWITNPNNTSDGDATNDTTNKTGLTPALSGVYTIGGTTPDYATIASALADLNAKGICGPTVMRVRDGVYTTNLNLGSIVGLSAVNPLRFESENGIAANCTIKYPALGVNINNFVVQLNGAKYVTVRNFTLKRTASNTYSKVINITGGAGQDSIYNNIIIGENTTSTSTDKALLVLDNSGFVGNNNYIANNSFKYGSNGIYMTDGFGTGLQVLNNTIDSSDQYGIYAAYFKRPTISGNTITNLQDLTVPTYGIAIGSDSAGFVISKNRIRLPNGGYGLFITNNLGGNDATKYGIASNNMISLGGTSSVPSFGIYDNASAGFTKMYYNSVYNGSANTASAAIYSSSTTAGVKDIVNNLFVNKGAGYAAYYAGTNASYDSIDYNSYFALGTNLTFANATNYTTLAAHKTGFTKDVNSLNTDPSYNSITNLHANSSAINAVATPLVLVTDDYDGTVRNATTPDIGADEFTPSPYDIGVSGFVNPVAGFCAGTTSIQATLKNFGTAAIDSANVVWYFNGVLQGTYLFRDTVSPIVGGGSRNITLGSVTTTNGVNIFDAKTVYVKALTIDANTSNDSFNYAVSPAMGGIYTIGGTSPNYTTLALAKADLYAKGICGPVTFNIRDGLYTEQIAFTALTGMNAVNTVTFQSQSLDSSKVTIDWPASGSITNNYTVNFKGSKYFIFNKVGLTRSGTSTYGTVVLLSGNSQVNTVKNSIVRTNPGGTSSGAVPVYLNATSDSGNMFNNNIIRGGYYAMYFYGVTSAPYTRRNYIWNNTIDSFYYYGIYMQYTDGFSVKGNYISKAIVASYPYGLYMYYNYGTDKQIVIENNRFDVNNTSASYGGYAMYMNYTYGSATKPTIIKNNMFRQAAASSSYYSFGIYAQYNQFTKIVNNSFYNAGSIANYYQNGCIYDYGSTRNTILNNNMSIVGAGIGITMLYPATVDTINNNNYFVSGGGVLGCYNYTNYTTDTTWKTVLNSNAWIGKDYKLKQINPQFVNVANTDLHVGSGAKGALNNLGTPTVWAKRDIDNEVRNATTPDIGADEFTPSGLDAGITTITSPNGGYCPGTITVSAIIKNYGTTSLSNASVSWKVNGVSQTAVYFNPGTPLATGSTATITLGSYAFSSGAYYIWSATSVPNGGVDGDNSNDSVASTANQALTGTYTIGGTSPSFASFSNAVTALYSQGVCGNVTFKVRDGVYADRALFIGAIPGANASNRVRFESENGDSSKVRLYYNATGTYGVVNATVRMIGASYISFKKIWIDRPAPSTYYYDGAVFEIAGGSGYDSITNCRLTAYKSASSIYTYQYSALIYSASDNDSFNSFTNNRMIGGWGAAYWYGSSTTSWERYNTFKGNYIDSCSFYGLSVWYNNKLTVDNNTIKNLQYSTPQSGYYGYYNKDGISFSGNYIDGTNAYYPVYDYFCGALTSTQTSRRSFANNMVLSTGGNTYYTYYAYDQYSGTNYLNNSISHNSSLGAGYYGAYIYYYSSGANGNIYNNNFVSNNSSHVASYIYGLYMDSVNYNNYYVAGTPTNVLNYNGANYATFAAYRSANPTRDVQGKNANPIYASSTDLHAQASALNGKGKDISGSPFFITKDFDGETRTSTPDIGADEFTPPGNDAGITSIDSPFYSYCGTKPVYVSLANTGTNTLTSATIRWKVNGSTATNYAWTGSILPGATLKVNVGNYAFTSGYYYVTAVSKLPNGVTDVNTSNDSLTGSAIQPGLSGTYTVGGTSPNYTTLTDAVLDLQNSGMCGSVVLNLRDGAYNEQVSLSLIPGLGATNSLTIKSQSGDSSKVRVYSYTQSSTLNYVIQLAGVNNVTIKNITIDASGVATTAYGSAIQMLNNNYNVTITNNRIWGKRNPTSTSYSQYGIYKTSYFQDSNIVIQNNRFRGAANGSLFLYGNSTTGAPSLGVKVQNNDFDSVYTNGIYLYYYYDGLTVKGNKVQFLGTATTTSYGMYLYYNQRFMNNRVNEISFNNIIMPANLYTNYGIYSYYPLNNATTPSSNKYIMYNNFISNRNTSGTSYALYSYYPNYMTIASNNISVNGASTSAYGGYFTTNGGNVIIRGNNFVRTSISGVAPYYSLSGFGSSSATVNNNNYYVGGGTFVTSNGSTYTTLALLQTGQGMDAGSVNVLPTYTSTTDLHVTAPCGLKNKGWMPTGVSNTDIDGASRGSFPDLGADEFVGSSSGVWVGSTDTLWTNTENWCNNTLPTISTPVTVSRGSTTYSSLVNPVVLWNAGTASAASITMTGTGAGVRVNGGILDVAGAITGGTLANPRGTVKYSASTTQTIVPIRYANLTLSSSNKTLGGNTTIDSAFTIGASVGTTIGANVLKISGKTTFGSGATLTGGSTSKIYVQGGAFPSKLNLPTPLTLSVLKNTRQRGTSIDGGNLTVNDSLVLTQGHLFTNTAPVRDTVKMGLTSTFVNEGTGWNVLGYLTSQPRVLTLSTVIDYMNGMKLTRNTATNPGNVTVTRVMANDGSMFNSYPLNHGTLTYPRTNQMWDIKASGATTGLSITMSIKYSDSSTFALNGRDESLLSLYSRTGSATSYKWEGRTSLNTSTNVLTEKVSHFTEFLLGGGSNPLPVELISFTANLKDAQTSILNWETASEENNSHFEIERSLDATSWLNVGRVEGKGTTQELSSYLFNDKFGNAITAPALYYRLKQVDFNGKFEYSEVKKVTLIAKVDGIKVWYNRNISKAQVIVTLANDKNVSIKLMDMSGKILSTSSQFMIKGSQLAEIDMQGVAKGLYTVVITTGNEVSLHKIFKN